MTKDPSISHIFYGFVIVTCNIFFTNANFQLREVGRKHRDQSKASSKTVEEQKEQIADLKKKLEEAFTHSKEPSPTVSSELVEKTKVGKCVYQTTFIVLSLYQNIELDDVCV